MPTGDMNMDEKFRIKDVAIIAGIYLAPFIAIEAIRRLRKALQGRGRV